jgi:hypothetical protein
MVLRSIHPTRVYRRGTSLQPDGVVDKGCRHDKRIERAIETSQRGSAAVERHVPNACDEELLADEARRYFLVSSFQFPVSSF